MHLMYGDVGALSGGVARRIVRRPTVRRGHLAFRSAAAFVPVPLARGKALARHRAQGPKALALPATPSSSDFVRIHPLLALVLDRTFLAFPSRALLLPSSLLLFVLAPLVVMFAALALLLQEARLLLAFLLDALHVPNREAFLLVLFLPFSKANTLLQC